jgi:inhibitor of KinA
VVEIPVCYEGDFGPDMADVVAHTGRSSNEIVRLHAGANYLVQCVGFTPGFPFLSGLPRELATPRRPTPRTQVPAGSVAIGGRQTGIYPLASPGGWNLIGRTPLRLFDSASPSPVFLQVGDRVRFRAISSVEFDSLGE